MKHKLGYLGLAGLLCGGMCALGIPLIAVGLSMLGLGWMMGGVMRYVMFVMFAGMYSYGLYSAYHIHRKKKVLGSALIAGVLLISVVAGWLPLMFTWIVLLLLVFAWIWSLQLLRKAQLCEESVMCDSQNRSNEK